MKKVQLIVIGAQGRLGTAIVEEAKLDKEIELKSLVVRKTPLNDQKVSAGDVILDASSSSAVATHLKIAVEKKAAYILAATGIDQNTRKLLEEASRKIAVVISPNLSVGVAVLKELVVLASTLLPDADVEIVEAHHRNKKDAPSGTAIALAAAISEVSHQKISTHSLRGGDVVGEHRVHFLLDGDRVELGHLATHRRIFAKGGLRAVKFVASAAPGLYTMRDILFG